MEQTNEIAGLHKVIHKQKKRIEMLEALIIRLGGDVDQSAFIIEKRRQVLDRKAKKRIAKQLKAKNTKEKPKYINKYKWDQRYLHPMWRKRRKQIIQKDDFKCRQCGNTHKLVVHHLVYQSGFQIWEYKDEHLVTWCENCHDTYHAVVPGSALVNHGIPIEKHTMV